ncbi:uncharacterized protein LOC122243007 [Penaeus japonicus]|uniref:uncharacterized protein LOC122243007 n=1 Tax=Penaeus japonicus TaxID=27405 RepID=UPI001C713C15|nr:uncharacterized protein LOC122243007 [Penaeus japonicus]
MRAGRVLVLIACVLHAVGGEDFDVKGPPRAKEGPRPLTFARVPFPPDDLVEPFVSKVTALPDYSLQDLLRDEVNLLHPFLEGHFRDSGRVKGAGGEVEGRQGSGLAAKDFPKDSTVAEAARNRASFGGVKEKLMRAVERQGKAVARQFSSLSFPSLEAALLSLAFLTFAVFLIDLVQDVLSANSTSSGRHARAAREQEEDQRTTDLIVLALTSLDTVSHGRENPECGQKLLCHLNRSGWHDEGILGTASNYVVSLFLALYSPDSGFQRNLDAAQFGREKQECVDKYTACPSILGDLIYHR